MDRMEGKTNRVVPVLRSVGGGFSFHEVEELDERRDNAILRYATEKPMLLQIVGLDRGF